MLEMTIKEELERFEKKGQPTVFQAVGGEAICYYHGDGTMFLIHSDGQENLWPASNNPNEMTRILDWFDDPIDNTDCLCETCKRLK